MPYFCFVSTFLILIQRQTRFFSSPNHIRYSDIRIRNPILKNYSEVRYSEPTVHYSEVRYSESKIAIRCPALSAN